MLNLPLGTVKWRLFNARKELKKGMVKLRNYGEKSFKPGHLNLFIKGIHGKKGAPFNLVQRMLPQNILLSVYESPKTIQ